MLELEITEGVLVNDMERTKYVLDFLHAQGFSLTIDDFGTGYSALSYLIKLPFDDIKIDISFVKQMGTNSDADVRIIVMLAQNLRLRSVAESVETRHIVRPCRYLVMMSFRLFIRQTLSRRTIRKVIKKRRFDNRSRKWKCS